MSISDAEIIEELGGADAVAVTFLIGEVPCLINDYGELMMVAGDDELMAAMTAYLRRIGVPEYPSEEAYEARGR
jgi:hypothetical protein